MVISESMLKVSQNEYINAMQTKLNQPMYNPASSEHPRYRSGAVARMVQMPVSTLRIWERRYQVVAPPMTTTGHRLYSGADVERLRLIRQLVDLGHAIGSIARLGLADLLAIAEASGPQPAIASARPPAQRPRTAMIGLGLPRRLIQRPLHRQHTWADLAAAEAALQPQAPAAGGGDSNARPPQADLLVAELATLQPDAADRLLALMRRLGVRQAVVAYAFGTELAAQRLRDAGCQVRRAPLGDTELLALVDGALLLLGGGPATAVPAAGAVQPGAAPPPRRFDDAGLAELASASTNLACECPRHVAELVAQLAGFETYSAECVQRASGRASLADQQLHQHLAWVAGTARALFEAALVRVAQAEAIPLPAAPEADAVALS